MVMVRLATCSQTEMPVELYPLLLADHPAWHGERGYSEQARDVLALALRSLDYPRKREHRFDRAYAVIRPFLDAPMCLHQRLRMWYLAACARSSRSEDRAALHWLDKTLDLESHLSDTADSAQLHVQRGRTYRRMLRFKLASQEHLRALSILSGDFTRSGYHDTEFKVAVLSQLVGFEFYQGDHWAARQHLDDARHLLPYVPYNSLTSAYLRWMHSLLDRWAGNAVRALKEARAAADIFQLSGDASSADRITCHTAECALDIAQQLDIQGSECDRKLAEARSYLKAARKLASGDRDEHGQIQVVLVEVRWSQIARRNEYQVAVLDQILAQARALDDEILIAQTFTTLGDEFALHEEPESANSCYRAALDSLEGTDSPAAGVWAWRALHIPREWDV